jgi:hypothetical protein
VAGGPGRFAIAGDGVAMLSGLGATLANRPLGPRPEFRDELRRRLVAAAANPVMFAPARRRAAASWAASWRGRRAIGALAAGLSLAAAGSGLAIAATSALPGGLLFGLKLDLEHVHYDVTSGDAARGRLELSFAGTRLHELHALGPNASRSAVLTDLSLLNSETRQGARLLLNAAHSSHSTAPLTALTRFALSSANDLHALLPVLPGSVQSQAGSSEALITQVGAQAHDLLDQLQSGGTGSASFEGVTPAPSAAVAGAGGVLVPLVAPFEPLSVYAVGGSQRTTTSGTTTTGTAQASSRHGASNNAAPAKPAEKTNRGSSARSATLPLPGVTIVVSASPDSSDAPVPGVSIQVTPPALP